MAKPVIKNSHEISIMRENGKRHAELNERVRKYIKEGVSTADIELFSRKWMKKLELQPIQIGYHGYPSATCIGINDDGLHCIPDKKKIVHNGDIVSYDTVVKRNGYCVDGGFTVPIGNVDSEGLRLIDVNKKALYTAISHCIEGETVGDIGKNVGDVIRAAGFSCLQGFVGHGIGKNMHEDPQIPNYGIPGQGVTLKAGMTFALDTMIAEGDGNIEVMDDGWSTKMANGQRLSFYEHTVVVGKEKAEILTD